ncbi:magnesium transporter [Taibaiella sp. KBW10]|uniref:magnesium transporter n=1 Tax=Taibaiella sp. KBW10 TaxID=2153357 RepID=UPI000F5A16CC|nr:magnesium transporter [Taibaiella sp. KBW10]RQO31492.1 magnesium transporter [Taibaiella sp. KBW10]
MEHNIKSIIETAEHLIEYGTDSDLLQFLEEQNISDVKELIDELPEQAPRFFELLPIGRSVHAFRILDFPTQARILKKLSGHKISELINELPPDDLTALFSELSGDAVKKLIILLPDEERKEALRLLGYKEDSVGRLMTPDYVAVKKHWKVSRVLDHIRRYGINSETIHVIYVIDDNGVLLDDLQIRKLLLADPDTYVEDIVDHRLVSLKANANQEEAVQVFRMNNRVALPVTDDKNILLGIVTVDDILWVANEEYTEDIQKIGGTEALDEPYLDTPLFSLFKKRVGWLAVLMLGEMLTATAMGFFEDQIQKAVVLSLFIPLIISCGGNSGSQASTLIIQAMALGEITLKDWWRVMRREIISGLMLGISLGLIGFARIYIWHLADPTIYGDHWLLLSCAISTSLIFVVLWGSFAGSMLPMLLKRLGADPATSSAPFVATLVDVTGLIIYFSCAVLFLRGVLL